jgi:uncharacterized protein YjbJ (UPF0337 family)
VKDSAAESVEAVKGQAQSAAGEVKDQAAASRDSVSGY